MWRCSMSFVLYCMLAGRLQAQDSGPAPDGEEQAAAPPTISAWMGYANNSTLKLKMGRLAGVDFVFGAIRAAYPLKRGVDTELFHTIDLLPVVLVSRIPPDLTSEDCPSDASCSLDSDFRRTGSAYGAGIMPAGWEVRWRLPRGAALFASARAGLVWFGRDVPAEGAARVNFLGGIGAGAILPVGDVTAVRVGYELNHLSNANTATVNPGLDWHVLTFGIVRSTAR